MSTLRVSTIQDTAGSNSSTPAAIANGIAKAWVNFNGTGTVAIRAQYNVSSITDNGTGNYAVNFTNALADANYAIVTTMHGNSDPSGNTFSTSINSNSASLTSSSAPVITRFNGGVYDSLHVTVAVFR